jgi:hypothetical protein
MWQARAHYAATGASRRSLAMIQVVNAKEDTLLKIRDKGREPYLGRVGEPLHRMPPPPSCTHSYSPNPVSLQGTSLSTHHKQLTWPVREVGPCHRLVSPTLMGETFPFNLTSHAVYQHVLVPERLERGGSCCWKIGWECPYVILPSISLVHYIYANNCVHIMFKIWCVTLILYNLFLLSCPHDAGLLWENAVGEGELWLSLGQKFSLRKERIPLPCISTSKRTQKNISLRLSLVRLYQHLHVRVYHHLPVPVTRWVPHRC